MKNEDRFKYWLNSLKESGKTPDEIGKILSGIAKYSGLETYNAILLSLTEHDIEEVEKIENESVAKERIEELFKIRTGISIDELVANIQTLLIDDSDYLDYLKKT